jgi:hypothetical protein
VQGRAFDTLGYLHRQHAYATLPLADARRLRVLLGEAIAAAEDMAVDQPRLALVHRRAA